MKPRNERKHFVTPSPLKVITLSVLFVVLGSWMYSRADEARRDDAPQVKVEKVVTVSDVLAASQRMAKGEVSVFGVVREVRPGRKSALLFNAAGGGARLSVSGVLPGELEGKCVIIVGVLASEVANGRYDTSPSVNGLLGSVTIEAKVVLCVTELQEMLKHGGTGGRP